MEHSETDLARLVAESEIRRTIADYCHSCDDGRFDDYGACFTPDAVMVAMGKDIVGREAIIGWITAAQPPERRGKHVTFNTLLEIDVDAGRAKGATDYMFLGRSPSGPQITTAGRYLDEFVPVDGRWLFARREITFLVPPGGG